MKIERVCSIACYLTGSVFFIVALFAAWPHFFTMSVCVAAGLLIAEDQSSATD